LPGATAITITRGPGVGAQLDIPLAADTTLIGRHPDCDVVLTDVTVSRRHAAIRRDGHTFTMTDLGSLNGTYVNRTPIDHVPLTDGDIVQIGAFRLVFRSGPAEVDSTPGGARPRLAAAAGGWSR
jgi:pSer/pThr/pTyr-binding forkhead associated (FHA) protein